MTDINFTSTYRIPITQAGINSAKKAKLKDLVLSYPNGLCGNSKVGNARVSIPDSEDANFVQKLKRIGYKVFQKFEGENIDKEELDVFIKEKLDTRDYNQKGKKMKKLTREMRDKRRFERRFEVSDAEKELAELDENIEKMTVEARKKGEVKNTTNSGRRVYRGRSERPEISDEEIKQLPKYLEYKEEYGEEFANAVFFGIKK